MQTDAEVHMSALDRLTQSARDNGVAALADGNDRERFGTLLIDGEHRAGSGERFTVLHPASNEAVGSVARIIKSKQKMHLAIGSLSAGSQTSGSPSAFTS